MFSKHPFCNTLNGWFCFDCTVAKIEETGSKWLAQLQDENVVEWLLKCIKDSETMGLLKQFVDKKLESA